MHPRAIPGSGPLFCRGIGEREFEASEVLGGGLSDGGRSGRNHLREESDGHDFSIRA